MTLRSCLLALSLSSLAACSDKKDSSTSGKMGSYDVTFASIHAETCAQANLPAQPKPHARLDLGQDAQGELRAVMTFAEKSSAVFAITRTPTSLVLDGLAQGPQVLVSAGGSSQSWHHFEIATDASGALGAMTATGHLSGGDGGDGECEVSLSGAGKIGLDTTAPTGRFEVGNSLYFPLLPWSEITLFLSEPLDPAALQGVLSASSTVGGSTTPVATTWAPASESGSSWVGASSLVSTGPWPDGATLSFALNAGVTDPSGHPLSLTTDPLSVLDAGPSSPSLDFDTVAPSGLWGQAKYLPAGDASCEAGGCVELPKGTCPSTQAGLVARLHVPGGATHFHARFLPSSGSVSIGLRTVDQPGETIDFVSDVEPTSGQGGSAWRTATHVLPPVPASRELYVVVSKGVFPTFGACSFNQPKLARVLIDRIWAD